MAIQQKSLLYYTKLFSKLKRDHSYGGAPHKPILLLSILHQIRIGLITQNRIYITAELVSTFKDFWNLLVSTPHTPNFSLPYYHMRSEGFWHLVGKPGYTLALTSSHSIRSFSSLKTAVAWAEFDPELYQLLQDEASRELLCLTIIQNYFPQCTDTLLQPSRSYLFQIEEEILNEPALAYQTNYEQLQKQLSREALEEETFFRNGAFKKVISNLYGHTCAISGLRVEATQNISIIDGCHIKPWSLSYDDTPANGIALCPNLHRAFDRGLISIDDNYCLLMSPHFIEAQHSPYSLNQFKGKQIILPEKNNRHPSQENLYYHRQKIFIK